MNRSISVCALMLLLSSTPLWALVSDREQPIQIEADSIEFDETKGISIYRGNVSFVQGSVKLLADAISTFNSDRATLEKVVATGQPVSFSQRVEGEAQEETVRGEARKIEYFAADEKLVLHGDAQLWRSRDSFSGNRIEYQTVKNVVSARKATDSKERVSVTIQPRKKPLNAEPSKPGDGALNEENGASADAP
ncbi:MAG: lipopolysaccharide transport periplasmic protein LptA [Gammaproteobacteria bacterium]|nr:lipopolysaccharide transport periplasmic protein LptA [Gammaproteobacteria bacterium]